MPLRLLRFLYGLLALATLALVALGGYVRGTGAGLSCPDWPLCFGMAVPDQILHPGVVQEVGHRYLASLVGLGTVLLSLRAIRARKSNPLLSRFSIWLLGVLGVQVVLGGLTVLLLLNPFIVTSHLIAGTLFFQSLALIAFDSATPATGQGSARDSEVARSFGPVLCCFAALIFLQIVIGGFVGSSGAALVCPDLPGCFGSFNPARLTGAQDLHMLHRLLAVVILAMTVVVLRAGRTLRSGAWQREIATLVLVQLGLGIGNVYFRVPVGVAVVHLLVAQLILLRVLVLYVKIRGIRFFPTEESAVSASSRVTGRPAQAIL